MVNHWTPRNDISANKPQEQHTMNQSKQQHAHALACKAHGLFEAGRQAEAFATYRAAVAAGYKTEAEEAAEKQARHNIQTAVWGFLVMALAAAAIAARAGFFF
jgi:hypothetical protein